MHRFWKRESIRKQLREDIGRTGIGGDAEIEHVVDAINIFRRKGDVPNERWLVYAFARRLNDFRRSLILRHGPTAMNRVRAIFTQHHVDRILFQKVRAASETNVHNLVNWLTKCERLGVKYETAIGQRRHKLPQGIYLAVLRMCDEVEMTLDAGKHVSESNASQSVIYVKIDQKSMNFELRHRGRCCELNGKEKALFAVLLAERQEQYVSDARIADRVWSSATFKSPDGSAPAKLRTLVKSLRNKIGKLLGEHSGKERGISRIDSRGYRLSQSISWRDSTAVEQWDRVPGLVNLPNVEIADSSTSLVNDDDELDAEDVWSASDT